MVYDETGMVIVGGLDAACVRRTLSSAPRRRPRSDSSWLHDVKLGPNRDNAKKECEKPTGPQGRTRSSARSPAYTAIPHRQDDPCPLLSTAQLDVVVVTLPGEGAVTALSMRHMPDCPQWITTQIGWEAGSRRIKEQDGWAKEIFPTAHERLKQAAAAMPPGTPAQPFIDALTELVQARADTTGFVVLHQWAEILERHFPPQLPGLDRTTGQPRPRT